MRHDVCFLFNPDESNDDELELMDEMTRRFGRAMANDVRGGRRHAINNIPTPGAKYDVVDLYRIG